MNKLRCTYCDSVYISPATGIEGVYRCNDCKEFFESDEFELDFVRQQRSRQNAKTESAL